MMNGIQDAKKHLDTRFAIQNTSSLLSELKLEIISQDISKGFNFKLHKIDGYWHLNSIFLYYFIYIVLGVAVFAA